MASDKKNWRFIRKRAYSRLDAATNDEYPIIKIVSHMLEQHLRYPENMAPEALERFSENSMIVKFWSPIVEATFCGSRLITNWGDTISLGPEKTNRRMDLRIVYGMTNCNDLGNAEFGKLPTEAKYFHDKAKLIISRKAQLNNFIKTTGDTSVEMALLLIQGLQAELFKLSLADNGLYQIVEMKKFHFPRLSSFSTDIEKMVDGCNLLRNICIDSHNKYEAAMVKKLSKMDGFAHEVKEDDFSSWLRPVWHPQKQEGE